MIHCGDLYSVCPIYTLTIEILWPFFLLLLSVSPEWDFSYCDRDSLSVFEWVG